MYTLDQLSDAIGRSEVEWVIEGLEKWMATNKLKESREYHGFISIKSNWYELQFSLIDGTKSAEEYQRGTNIINHRLLVLIRLLRRFQKLSE